jgi:hypothetical protein|tara:strand:- start:541 stop:714 length:174 start_codon:yes stop_codon:yes gene_type:complete
MSKNRTRFFETLRKDNCIEIWMPPANNPEGEFICTFDVFYINDLIAALNLFKQKEKL